VTDPLPVATPHPHRVLLKLSGEALMGDRQYGIDPEVVRGIAAQVAEARRDGIEVAVVVGVDRAFERYLAVRHGDLDLGRFEVRVPVQRAHDLALHVARLRTFLGANGDLIGHAGHSFELRDALGGRLLLVEPVHLSCENHASVANLR